MLFRQTAAVDTSVEELTKALHYLRSRDLVSAAEERNLRESGSRLQEAIRLFHVLNSIGFGQSSDMSYLRTNHQSIMGDLNLILSGQAPHDNSRIQQMVLQEFSHRLAQYYIQDYAYVPTMGESDCHVKDVWVPLQIDGRREHFLAPENIDHVELLTRLKSSEYHNIALIKGDPGMGKTTLTKKIAYDWAVNYGSSDTLQFSLVLVVPLRSAGKSDNLYQLAIDYFAPILCMESLKAELVDQVNLLRSQLLVVFDGLDQYRIYAEGPFKSLFAAPFHSSLGHNTAPPPFINFKLIITARPYACERASDSVVLLRYVIMPPEDVRQFKIYCHTAEAVSKVTDFLQSNSQLVIRVPLILTVVCFLADSEQDIPTNLTKLYDRFIRQMIKRVLVQDLLEESIDLNKWKDSQLAEATSKLAHSAVLADMRQLSHELLKENHVTNDNFRCGFLLHKFDFCRDCLMAEFPHRSIQEFFAALHCYRLMLQGCTDDLKDIYSIILNGENLIGRFFFGICSQERRIKQMYNWLGPQFLDSCPSADSAQINRLLVDCTSEQHRFFFQRLFEHVVGTRPSRLRRFISGLISPSCN